MAETAGEFATLKIIILKRKEHAMLHAMRNMIFDVRGTSTLVFTQKKVFRIEENLNHTLASM